MAVKRRTTRKDVEVAAVLVGVLCIAGGAALAYIPLGLLTVGAALVAFGVRGGV